MSNTWVQFPTIFTNSTTPMDLYYHNNDVLMFLWSTSTPSALIVSWLLCSTETNYDVYFLYRVGNVMWPFLLLQSAQPSSMFKLESRDQLGGLRRLFIAPLHCTSALMSKSIKQCWRLTPSSRRPGWCNRAKKRLQRDCRLPIDISIDFCVVVAS